MELRNGLASRWDFDRYVREQDLEHPFTDGATFADVDIEIERRRHFLVIEGKRTGEVISRGQMRAMRARYWDGRTVLIVWGDPDTGTVTHMGTLATTFAGQHTPKLYTRPATLGDVMDYMAAWWDWASEADYPRAHVSAFGGPPDEIITSWIDED
jgi:hypothetical protein